MPAVSWEHRDSQLYDCSTPRSPAIDLPATTIFPHYEHEIQRSPGLDRRQVVKHPPTGTRSCRIG